MDFLDNLSGTDLVILAAIISIWLSQGLNTAEIDNLGNFFTAIGTNLTTIASSNSGNILPN